MANPDLGEKRVCSDCGAKFFDLKKRPVVCPKCGFSYDPDSVPKRPARKAAPTPKPEEAKDKDGDEDADENVETESDEDSLSSDEGDQKELSLDDAAPLMSSGGDDEEATADSDSGGGSTLPKGYTEEGVEDDSDILSDDEDEDAKMADEENMGEND